ncbi:helix-turn-helix domain-containing protein [Nocardia terpenica]|uniref:helix-turn-helix domain-containing protein n=1 Tax=Nocardia terpenica TaxID=455432 RepID=UPI00142D3379|nr:helix-turn-helix transcriptional regulator [Nocardia terpenica]
MQDTTARHRRTELGRRLRDLRERAGFTQVELASAAGIDRAYLVGIEAGKRNFTIDKLFALLDAIGAEPAALFSDSNAESNEQARTRKISRKDPDAVLFSLLIHSDGKVDQIKVGRYRSVDPDAGVRNRIREALDCNDPYCIKLGVAIQMWVVRDGTTARPENPAATKLLTVYSRLVGPASSWENRYFGDILVCGSDSYGASQDLDSHAVQELLDKL